MYRILLTDEESATLNGNQSDAVFKLDTAEEKLGFLLGRAVYLEGLPISSYQNPAPAIENWTSTGVSYTPTTPTTVSDTTGTSTNDSDHAVEEG